jgi:phosphoserine phosphatase RsbU/P
VAPQDPLDRVLIVDDEEPLALAMARTLLSRGIESDVALSAAQARECFQARDYALVLLDVKLPDESGYGLLEELRSRRPAAAVVMITGLDDPELGRAALDHGAYGYVIKPVGATQLYLLAVDNLRRRTVERDHVASVERLESVVAERADQMRQASSLQGGMLPTSPLKDDGFHIAAKLAAAREVSGDFYDWYRSPTGRLIVTVADVMGKGLPAALMMATARAALRGSAPVEDLGEGLRLAANAMAAALDVNHAYVTVFHCSLDPRTGDLKYVDAGHGHARLLRGLASQEVLTTRSLPVGIYPDTKFPVGELTLNRGDTLVIFSDGLLELRPDLSSKDVRLPHEAWRAGSVQEMVDVLARGADKQDLQDDVTVLALRRV